MYDNVDWIKVDECYRNGALYLTEYVNKEYTLFKQEWGDGRVEIYETGY